MFHMNVAKVDLVLHMLQWLYTCVAIVRFKCFSYFKRTLKGFHLGVSYVAVAIHICCKYVFQMFQLFYLYVAVVIYVCCKRMFQMFQLFQTYVLIVSLDISLP
jgi:hypothetical protein